MCLGAGRSYLGQAVDHGVGVEVLAACGAEVGEGEPVLMAHHRASRGLADAMALLERAVVISDEPPAVRPILVDRVNS
jgi:thymidine phosphorylase